MINLKDFMEVVGYAITEGYEYQWNCFGPDAYGLDSWSEETGYSIGVIFDRKNQFVYSMEAHDYNNNRSYRWIHPNYKFEHDAEADKRNVDKKQAWDDVKFIDLDLEEDILEKSRAIANGENYDVRVMTQLTLPEEDVFILMKQAHEKDMTFNELVEQILREEIKNR